MNQLENLQDMSVFDDFFNEIENTGTSESGEKSAIQRIWMNAPINHGRINFVPYPDTSNPNDVGLCKFFDGVLQLMMYNPELQMDTWVRILEKECYGTLTPEEDSLWNEVKSLWWEVWEKDLLDRFNIKRANYGVFFGKVLNHFSPEQKVITDTKKEMSLIIFPSRGMRQAIKDSINSLEASGMAGSKADFMPAIYNGKKTERRGFLSINFTLKSADSGFGFDVNVMHSIFMGTPTATTAIPAGFEITDKEHSIASSITQKFLGSGWDKENNKPFKKSLFEAVRDKLKGIIKNQEIKVKEAESVAKAHSDSQLTNEAPPAVQTLDPMLPINNPNVFGDPMLQQSIQVPQMGEVPQPTSPVYMAPEVPIFKPEQL